MHPLLRRPNALPLLALTLLLLSGCVGTKEASWSDTNRSQPEAAGLAADEPQLAPSAAAVNTALAQGDCVAGRTALDLAFAALAQQGIESDAEKLAYLDAHFPLPNEASYLHVLLKCEALVGAEAAPLPEPQEPVVLSVLVAEEIAALTQSLGQTGFTLEPALAAEIEGYIVQYQTEPKFRQFFERSLRRARKYVPLLAQPFAEKGLPPELILGVATQESGFNPTARSHAAAQGAFQFMRGTARQYGLRVDSRVDERNAPLKAGIAASKYLHDLLRQFGDVTLAIAAYNGGPGRVRGALRRLGPEVPQTFWSIRSALHAETRSYVPRVLAAAIAGKHAARLGFDARPWPDVSQHGLITISHPASLDDLARAAGITRTRLIALNEDLEPGDTYTPNGVVEYPLFVPAGTEAQVEAVARAVAATQQRQVRTAASRSSSSKGPLYVRYKVQSGNTLSGIAAWFGKSVSEIKGWNPALASRSLQAGEVVYVRELPRSWKRFEHRVARGETLSAIATRYRIRIADLKAWNGLRSDTISVGKKLVIYTQADIRSS